MSDERRLGIEISANDRASVQVESTVARLRAQINSLRDAIAGLDASNMRASASFRQALENQVASAESQLKRLTAAYVQQYSGLEQFNIRAIAAMRGQADAIKGVARELGEADRIMRSGSGRVAYGAVDPIALRVAQTSVAEHRATQERLNAAFGAIPTGGRAASGAIREVEYSTSSLNRALAHTPALMDGAFRGQTRQMIATIGAAMRDAGIGAVALTAGIGGIVAAGAAIGIHRMIVSQGELAEKTLTAAAAAGMSAEQYQVLQRTMELAGGGSERLAGTFRILATQVQTALADPMSKARSGFDQLFGADTQRVLERGAQDTLGLVEELRKKFQSLPDDMSRTATMSEATGRAWQELASYFRLSGDELAKLQALASRGILSKDVLQDLATAAERSRQTSLAWGDLEKALSRLLGGSEVESGFARMIRGMTDFVDEVREGVHVLGSLGFALDQIQRATAFLPFMGGTTGPLVPALPTTPAALPTSHYVAGARGGWRRAGPPPATFDTSGLGPPSLPPEAVIPPEVIAAAKAAGAPVPSVAGPSAAVAPTAEQLTKTFATTEKVINEQRQRWDNYYSELIARARAAHREDLVATDEKLKAQVDMSYAAAEKQARDRAAARAKALGYTESGGAEERIREGAGATENAASRARIATTEAEGRARDQAARSTIDQLEAERTLTTDVRQRQALTLQIAQLEAQLSGSARGRLIVAQAEVAIRRENVALAQHEAEATQTQGQRTIRGVELSFRAQQLRTPGATFAQYAPQELAIIEATAQREIALWQAVENTAGATATQIQDAENKIKDVRLQAANDELQIQVRVAEETKRQADKMAKPFVDAFNTIGSSIEDFIDKLVTSSGRLPRGYHGSRFQYELGQAGLSAGNELFRGAVKDFGELLSQKVASMFGAQAGQGLGQFLGTKVAGLLGMTPQISQTAAITANTAALVANTAALTGASAAALPAVGGGIMSLFHWIPGFAGGGIVPSAVGGMIAPGGGLPGGGQLSILHPQEMVLPAHISQGFQNMLRASGAPQAPQPGIAFAPMFNANISGRPFMPRGDASEMLRGAGDLFEGFARNWARNKGYAG